MKIRLTNYAIVLSLLMNLTVLGQNKADISKYNVPGKVYFKDGSVKTGKITFKSLELELKEEGGKRYKVDKEKVDKFESYNRKGKLTGVYGFVLTKRNLKRKTKFILGLEYEGETIRLYNEPVLVMGMPTSSYFVQREGEPYAVKMKRKKMTSYFEDCESLKGKIGSAGYKKVSDVVQAYDTDCK